MNGGICNQPFLLLAFDKTHLAAEAVDDNGEVVEEVIADHACGISSMSNPSSRARVTNAGMLPRP